MDTQKLHALIDKVIGKDGPLRVPAYWMRRVLKEVVNNITEMEEWFDYKFIELNHLLNSKLGIALEYKYDQLKKLKDRNSLTPGQEYIISDYKPFFRQSYEWAEIVDVPQGRIFIKAITNNSFDENVILIRDGKEYFCKYCFDRNPLDFDWCPYDYEYYHIVLRHSVSTTSPLYRLTAANTTYNSFKALLEQYPGYVFYGYPSDGAAMPARYALSLETNEVYSVNYDGSLSNSPVTELVEFVTDSYKGIIYELVYKDEPKRFPYDPLHVVYFTEELSGVTVDGWEPVLNLQSSSIYIGDNISAINTPGTYYSQPQRKLPLIRITGLRANTANLSIPSKIFIGPNCSRIIANMNNDGSLYIEGNCTNMYLRYVNANIAANSSRIYVQWPVKNLNLIGNCTDITIRNSSYMNISTMPLVMPCNIEVHSSKNLDLDLNLQTLPKANVVVWPLQLTEKTTISLRGIVESNFEGCLFIGRDSIGTIRQWNPADFVDAVEVEEQTIETVEE